MEKLENGSLAIVNVEGEWLGAIVMDSHNFMDEGNLYSVQLLESTVGFTKGDVHHNFNQSETTDEDGEKVAPTIRAGKALVMRTDRGEYGVDRMSLGSGISLEDAMEDTLRSEGAGDHHFDYTVEAIKGLRTKGFWTSPDSKVQYFFTYFAR